jgi:Ca2+-binding RTX toxin-like protein
MAEINGDLGDNTLIGTSGDDIIFGDDGNDIIKGAEGNDDLQGGAGDDVITGGSGDDIIHGGSGSDTVSFLYTAGPVYVDLADGVAFGQAGSDSLNSIENIVGSAYYDDLYGDETANVIYGMGGIDYLFGRLGDDTLFGGDDTDLLVGDLGNDHLDGGRGGDSIYGGDGVDFLDGGAGGDYLNGGEKADVFVYTETTDSVIGKMDLIADYKDGKDILDVSLIDANEGLTGNQAFFQVEAFTGVAGQLVLSYDSGTGRTFASFDNTGDGVADMVIAMRGSHLSAAGWIL